MEKRKKILIQKMVAVLLSGVLSAGMAFGGIAPIRVFAQVYSETECRASTDAMDNTVSGTEMRNEIISGNDIVSSATVNTEAIGSKIAGSDTVSGNTAGAVISGDDWELDADGRLIIRSDIGMTDWKNNGWDTHKEKVKDAIIMDGVTEVVKAAFQKCTNMVSVDMPDSVSRIDWRAFDECSSLKAVSIPNGVKELWPYTFRKCEHLVSVRLPESLERIGNTFEECSRLEEIVIPPNVERIAAYTFKNCVQLEKVIMCSENVTIIEGEAFSGCKFYEEQVKDSIIIPPGTKNQYIDKYMDTGIGLPTGAQRFVPYLKEHIHAWESSWSSNPFHHWHECTSECTTRNIADKEGYALHMEDSGTITKQPTQTETGIKSYHCSICGYKMREESIPMTGIVGDDTPDVSGNEGENSNRPQDPSNPGSNEGDSNSDNINNSDNTENSGNNNMENDGSQDNTGSEVIDRQETATYESNSDNLSINAVFDTKSTSTASNEKSKDHEPETGDDTQIELYATLAMVMGFAWLFTYFADSGQGMTEEEKKKLVSKLIAWAKQGGRPRRIFAIAVIFILLLYYHSIGKKTIVEWKRAYGE